MLGVDVETVWLRTDGEQVHDGHLAAIARFGAGPPAKGSGKEFHYSLDALLRLTTGSPGC
ncbi:MAG TPA: hypothetical protein VIQ02_16575 [Jiangellaceae bacterium]